MREYREALREEYEDEYDFEAYEDEEEYEEDIAPKKQRVNKNRQTARRADRTPREAVEEKHQT